MFTKLLRNTFFRNFSNSVIGRNVEKKTAETPTSTDISSQGYMLAKKPTKFQKKILILSGSYKTEEEVPKYITSEALDKAQSKVRIKIANGMIVVVLLACGTIIFWGKSERKEKLRIWQEKQDAAIAEKELKEAAHVK